MEGLVRKATEVRPRIVEALFQCLRCGAVIKEAQEGLNYREPLECYEDQGGCARTASATKWKLLDEGSRYVDTQKLEIQEPPEELRGGESPQRLVAYLEDDLTGFVNPGDRVVLNGVLRGSQRGRFSAKSTLFDVHVDGNSVEMEEVEYEEIEITEEDETRIREEASTGDVIRKIVGSIAPSIYGMTVEKEALALQLFGGVPKQLPDGRRIRGDTHLLLVGDPGCLIGDERIVMGDGTIAKLEGLGSQHLEPIDVSVRLGAGGGKNGWATRFHRYENQPLLEVITESGKSIKGTYNHPLLVWNPARRESEWKRLDELQVDDRLRVAPSIRCTKRGLVPTGWEEPDSIHRSWHVKVPEVVDEKLAALLGYVLGDGWVQERQVGFLIPADEMELEPLLIALFEEVFGVTPTKQSRRHGTYSYQVDRTAIAGWLKGLSEKRVPDAILESRNSVVASFLRWLFEADGTCFANGRGRTAIQLRSAERELLRDVQALLLRWGIHSRILWGDKPSPDRMRSEMVRGTRSGNLVIRQANSLLAFAEHIGFPSEKKGEKLAAVIKEARSRTRRWRPKMTERVTEVRPAGVGTVYDIEVPGPQRFIANGIISHNTAKSELLTYMTKLSPRGIYASGKASSAAGLTAAAVRDEFGEGRWTLEAGALVLADKGLACLHPESKVQVDGRTLAVRDLFDPVRAVRARAGGDEIEVAPLNRTVPSFDRRTAGIRPVNATLVTRRWHSGPLLQVVSKSGSVLRLTPDHLVLEGRSLEWRELGGLGVGDRLAIASDSSERGAHGLQTLSMGRIRLDRIVEVRRDRYEGYVYDLRVPETANFLCEGIVVHNCIDEIEKMSDQDRSAIHTAMEQQTIHVAKAGITATLQTRCAILAAANPTLGRFDENKFIAEQINLPPTLMSRFDGIFPIMDKPQAQYDQAMAEHILKGHLVGEQIRQAESQRRTPEASAMDDAFLPYLEPAFLRKYVAYAKRIYPVLTDEAMDILKEKYLDIRKQGEGEGGTVPITPRQLEAFIRLAEASARARLSPVVQEEDAERSVRIIEYWLQKVTGLEGGFDIDVVATGISGSQRAQMVALREIIADLSERDGAADLRDILEEAEDRGIPPNRVEAWLRRWSQEGEVYSPAANKWKLVSRY